MKEFLNDEIMILNSVENFTLIGQGNTAEIYAYNNDSILKLFYEGFPKEGAVKEWEISNKVQEVYVMMPRALKFVVYEKRYGILYEKASRMDMFLLLRRKPFSIFGMGKRIALIHAEIHKTSIDGVLTVKEKLTQEIGWAEELTSSEKARIIKVLNTLPEKNSLCHFDFHPGNILAGDLKYQVIDWMTACAGDPAADIARTWLLLKYGQVKNADKKTAFIVSAVKTVIRGQYLRNVCRLSHITKAEVKKWILPVAAARLSEWLTESERVKLLKLIREKEMRRNEDGSIQKFWKEGNAILDDVKSQEDCYEEEIFRGLWGVMSVMRWKNGFC